MIVQRGISAGLGSRVLSCAPMHHVPHSIERKGLPRAARDLEFCDVHFAEMLAMLAALVPTYQTTPLLVPRSALQFAGCRRVACDPVSEATDAAPTTAADGSYSLPPDSFLTLLEQAAESAEAAISDGSTLLEIEFPPVPTSKLDDSSLSAYDILSANLQFAVEFSKRLTPDPKKGTRRVALTLPDSAERQRAAKYFGDEEPWPGMQLWSLNGGDESADDFSPMALFGSLFKQGSGKVVAAEWADMYVIIGASAQELPAIQQLHVLAPSVPIICFNLKLDVLRGDLGLPGFPPRCVTGCNRNVQPSVTVYDRH